MAAPVVGRQSETQLIADFLQSATLAPAGLVIEGEPGIGKTTLWQAAVDLARERGFEVLSTRPAAAESVLAYAALTDMVGGIEDAVWAELPNPQRFAINRALSGAGAADSVADPRGVTAGFLSLVMHMQEAAPVLLAIDDLQWLDSSSMRVVAFAARRLAGRVGIIGTVRMEPDSGDAAAWVQLPRFMELRRIRLGPLSMGGLRQVVSERLGQALPRSRAVRIHEVSHGNPFYALELAKVLDAPMPKAEARLPGSLVELVRERIGSHEAATQNVLLAAACAYAPTVDLVARATGNGYERVLGLLSVPEDNGIVRIDGHRLSFTHPLLARGVYSEASSAARRKMHRMLAGIVEEPELQARHLAMAVTRADPHTVSRLDDAAEMARARGAPAAAAELLDLALGLGGDTAERRIRLAGNHFEAGDSERARGLLEQIVTEQEPGPLRAVALSLLGSVRAFDDSFTDGVELWKRSVAEAGDNLALRVPTLVILALTQFSTGRIAEGVPTADQAVADAGRLGDPLLLSQALGVRVLIHFLRGQGIDEADLQRALELEKRGSSVASAPGLQMVLRPSLQHGLLLGWTGEFERAHRELLAVRQLCAEHGHEFELMYVAYYSAQIAIWWGDLTEAAAIGEDAMNRAEQTGGDIVTGAALTIRAALATHAGSEEQARRDAEAAITMHQRCGARMLAEWPIALLGFLEVSLGHYEAALTALQPLLSRYAEGQFGMEIHVAGFVPDAVEALVHVGRLDEAEKLVDDLERNGRRLDRAWMLAVGGRCRGMIHGARGDLEAAVLAAQEAMRQHERISMPFDLARTQLVLGQLERRRRHREAATAALRGALDIFERLGAPLWAARASAELARTGVAAAEGASELTVGEQRVAGLAATGMKNRDVAAALFISPKTVEANLARIYRKLGIHSRAELGRLMADDADVGGAGGAGVVE